MSKTFVRYRRDKKRRPIGLVVVFRSNRGELKAGYSQCNPADPFDRTEGRNIALRRAEVVGTESWSWMLDEAPHGMASFVEESVGIAQRFFSAKPKSGKRKSKVTA